MSVLVVVLGTVTLIVFLSGGQVQATETCKYNYKCSSYTGLCAYDTRTCDDICCDDKTKGYYSICCSSGSNIVVIAGGAGGGTVGFLILVFFWYWCCCRGPKIGAIIV